MNLLLITDGITPFVTGGMQRHSANLAKYFTRAGIKVTLVHCVPHDNLLPTDAEVNASLFESNEAKLYKIITLHFPKPGKVPGHYLRESYQYSKRVYESVDVKSFDFIYAKGYSAWYTIEQKKRGESIPPIGIKFHGYEMYQNLPTLKQKLESKILQKPTRWNNENADYIFSYGGKITDLILKKFKVNNKNVFNFASGLNQDWLRTEIEPKSNKIRKLVFMGRDERRKGVHDLNRVLDGLPEDLNFEFHFIGPIPKSKQLKHPKYIYHGELRSKTEICQILDQMDILVCPSHAEGMPNVILEGMARGLAVVATDVGAVEMLVNKTNGQLIPPFNETLLTDALLQMINLTDSKLDQLKLNALQRIENEFLWSKLIINIIHKINEAIDNQ